MALDNFRKVNITLNKANQRVLETQIAKVGDANGRELVVQITNNGIIEDQTGTTLKLNWQHENGNQGSTNFKVVDIETGRFSVYYPKEMLYKGKVNASIEITSNGQITNSMNFKIIVHADVFNGEAGTVDGVFISLADVNKKLDDREKEYEELKERQSTVETQFNAIQQDLTGKDVISAPEIIAARNGEENLKTRIDKDYQEVTAKLVQTTIDLEQRIVNVKTFGAIGDGIVNDTDSIKNAIAYCGAKKYNLFFPAGDYLITETINGLSNIALIGSGINNTTIIKKNESVNNRGIDAVFDFYQKNNFKVCDIRVIGNRKPFAEGNTVTTYGLYLEGSSYFNVENFKGMDCKRAIMSITNWCCTFTRPVGQRCQEYAFQISNSSTSQVWVQPVAWGTGGNFHISGSTYLTIISPACDHSDAGGRVDDPFLPMGSGGDYLNPSYIFRISSSNVTIISPGTENSYSKYIYSEGSQVTLLNPYVWKLQNYSDVYSFIELRGTGKSDLFITNPDFRNIENKLEPNYLIRGVFIESPSVQKITINKAIEIDESFGGYKYVGLSGVFFSNKKKLIPNGEFLYGFSPENSPFIPYNTSTRPDGAQTIEFNGKTRQIKFDKGSSTVNSSEEFGMKFRVPLKLENQGSKLLLNIRGTYTTGGHSMPTLQIRKGADLSDEGSLLKEIPLSENKLDFDNILEINNLKNDYVYFQLNLVSGSTTATLTKLGVYEL